MCRILGYYGPQSVPMDLLITAAKKQNHGGPDAQYIEQGKNYGLSINRLAIQDLEGGVQPFRRNSLRAIYNGEIYNHKALRYELERKGYSFDDHCDGNVILPLYEQYGENFVSQLNGMFIIALIDEQQQKIILATDPSGIKSLYYYYDAAKDMLYFASELKALFTFPIKQSLRAEAVHEYLVGRALWHHRTFFQGIEALPPHTLLVKTPDKIPQLKSYTYPATQTSPYSFEQMVEHFDEMMSYEMNQMLAADVPVCLVTSGGLDSSYLTALAAQQRASLDCFHVSYEGAWPDDERHYAKAVASHCNLTFNQVLISEQEFPRLLMQTLDALGQPNTAPHSLSTYALFQAIQQAGYKVAITGEGADEYFAGYDRFKNAVFNDDLNWLDSYFDALAGTTSQFRSHCYSSDYLKLVAQNPLITQAQHIILEQEKRINSRLQALLSFDQEERFPSYILRRVDHLSMVHGVEVRVPFCQPAVTTLARQMPDSFLLDQWAVKKIVYAAAKNKLPEAVLTRKKQPFTLPIVAMLKKGHILFSILQDTLHSQRFRERGFFNNTHVTELIERQSRAPDVHVANMLWALMILELWLQQQSLNF